MRIILHKVFFLFTFLFLSQLVFAQTVSDTATFYGGVQSTVFNNNTTTNSNAFGCSDTLKMSIGAGRYITSVDVFYTITAPFSGNGWISEQRSFVEYLNTNTTEANVTLGNQTWDSSGTETYTRAGLNFANGAAGAGDLLFFLHAFRTFGANPNCSSTVQFLPDSTFTVIVNHIPLPTCTEPTNLAVGTITKNTVQLNWSTGGATNWQIEYGPVGFTSGSGTLVNATSNPFTVSGLTDGTPYDFRVRDSCAVGDVSFWSNTTSVYTLCNAYSAPFLEDFENVSWTTGNGNFGTGTIDTCWIRNYTSDFVFKSAPKNFVSNTTGPAVDHTSGTATGKFILSERLVNSGAPYTATIQTPAIEMSALTVPQLSFWYYMYGAQIGTLSAEISTDGGNTFTSVWTLSSEQQNNRNAPWLEATVDLSVYSTDTIIVQFTVLQSLEGGLGDVSLDDVEIRETPTCLEPTNFAVDFSWINKAQLSFTSGGAADWELEYGAPGFTIGAGTRITANTNPAQISGLLSNTTYEVYVRDSCGANDVSNWVGPVSFTTFCTTVLATPHTENFDGTNWTTGTNNADLGTIETCWFRSPLTPYAWKTGPALTINNNSGTQNDHTSGSGQFAYAERLVNFANDTIEAELITPPIDLSTLTNPQVSFWYHMFGNSVVNLNVEINTGNGWTSIYTKTGQQQTSTTEAWQEAVVNLGAYGNDTAVFRFTTFNNNGGTNNDVSIDDFFVGIAPSCQTPTDFNVLGTTQNSVSLQWTNLGNAAFQNIEYGASGFALGSGTYLSSTGNPSAVAGLTASTTYEFYLRDSCAVGGVSAWLGPISATTDCAPIAAPLIENFDGATWTLGNNNTPGVIDACWRRDSDSAFVFTAGQNGTTSNNTGPSADHTSGTGKFLYTETYFGFAFSPNVTVLSTPLVDVSALINPELKFYYHAYGADFNTLNVRVFNGSTSTIVHTISGAQQNASAAPWNEVIVDLIAYAGDTIKVAFEVTKAVGVSFTSDFALDDVSIAEQPACPKPANLTVSNATANSVDLAWTSGGATDWQIEYGTTGFTQGNGTIAAANANPSTLSGLSPSTTYDFYVRDSCGVGSTSDWIGPVTLNTLCTAVLAPYSENFDGSNFDPGAAGFGVAGNIDPCWNRNPIATYFWKTGPSTPQSNGTGSTIGDHTSGNGGYIFTESGGFAGPPLLAEITTPQIDLTPLTSPELSYWYHMFGNNVNELYVEVSTDNGLTYIGVDTLSGNQQNAQNDLWLEAKVNLSAFVNQTVTIKFTAEKTSNGNQSDISIDDVKVDEAPTCPKPSALAITGASASSITLNWTSGGATDWQVVYGAAGYNPTGGIGAGTLVNVGSNPFTVSGLSSQTEYCFYVRDSCAAGDVSEWSLVSCGLTDCGLLTAPHTENFDGTEWVTGTGIGNAGSLISNCWTVPTAANPNFSTGNGPTTSGGSGPTADATTGNGNYIYTEASGGALGAGEIASPLIYVPSSILNPRVGFNYHMFGANIDSLEVLVDLNGIRTKISSTIGQQQATNADAWIQKYSDISAFSGDTIRIVFIGTNNGFNGDIAIDDFSIEAGPSCLEPSALNVTATNSTSVTLAWTTGGATNWQIEYGAPGFTNGTGTLINVTTNPFTISGLTNQTSYEFYVRDSCGANDLSLWNFVSANAITDCSLFTAPFAENFDGASWVSGTGAQNTGFTISSCWTRATGNNPDFSTRSGVTASFNTGPSGDFSGTGNYLFTEASQGAIGAGEISSPSIYIPTTITNPRVGFQYYMYGANIDSLQVAIEKNGIRTIIGSLVGEQQTTNTAPWVQQFFNAGNVSGDTVRIVFIGTNNGFNGDIAIDDVVLEETPACPAPNNLAITATNSNSVTLSWTTGGATNWQIEYGAPGFVSGSGTVVMATTNPFTVTGLNPQTGYEFYVRDSCGAASTSTWNIIPVSDTTACGVFLAPFNESFDGPTFISGGSVFNPGSIDDCWDRTLGGNYFWAAEQGATASANTGPSADHTTGTGKFMFTDGNGGAQNTPLTTPFISLVPLSNPQLRFWYHMYGASINRMEVEVWDGAAWVQAWSLTGQQQTANTDAWQEAVVSLSAYAGDTVQLRFIGYRNAGGTASDMALDDVQIVDSTGCATPSNLSLVTATTSTLQISWSSLSTLGSIVKYRPVGSTAPFSFTSALSGSTTITGLQAGTTYQVLVRDSCGADVSLYTSSSLFSTLCGTINAPFLENFDGAGWALGTGNTNVGDLINACWTRDNDTATRWTTGSGGTPSNQTGPFGDFNGGGNFLYTEASIGTGTSEILSPSIFLPTFLTQPILEFYYYMYGQDITSLSVEIDNGNGFTSLRTISGQQQVNNFAAWLSDTVNLSAYSGDTIRLKFVGINTGFRGDISIDNISITGGTGPCAAPSNITFSNITSTSASVSWVSNSGLSDVEVVAQGAAQGTGVIYPSVASPFVITGLTAGASYDIYVRDVCGTTSSTWISNTVTTTGCLALTTSITISNKTATGFDVNWTSLSGVSDIQVVTTGSALGSGFSFNSVTSPYTVAGLAVNTTYDVYVRDRCGADSTAWINFTTSTLSCIPVVINNMVFSRLGLNANFNANVTGQDSLMWDFGNGNTSTAQNPTEVYATAGAFTVVLSAYNACGNSAFDTLMIEVCDSIIPSFTFTNTSDSVFFDASTTSGASFYYWDFGNGNTGTGAQTKTPLINGTMTVTLIADNSCGDSVVLTKTIQVCKTPIARWTYTIISTSSSGMLVQFDASASQNASTYDWNFGDGNTATGTAVPQHNYLVPSLNYTVTMVASNPCGNSSTSAYKLNQIGLEENLLDAHYTVYPNPASDDVTIDFESATDKPTKVELYDLQGKLLSVYAVDTLAESITIDIHNVASGTYVLKVTDAEGVHITRVTKY